MTLELDMGILKAGMITTIHMDIAKKKDNQTGFYIAKKKLARCTLVPKHWKKQDIYYKFGKISIFGNG